MYKLNNMWVHMQVAPGNTSSQSGRDHRTAVSSGSECYEMIYVRNYLTRYISTPHNRTITFRYIRLLWGQTRLNKHLNTLWITLLHVLWRQKNSKIRISRQSPDRQGQKQVKKIKLQYARHNTAVWERNI